jgi:hypothetical protein
VLGLIQRLLLLGFELFQQWPSVWMLRQWFLDWVLYVALSLCFYLFIPAVEGFLTARQNGDALSASGPGCLVGGIGFLVLALAEAYTLLFIPPPDYTPRGIYGPSVGDIVIIITLSLLFEGLTGAIFGTYGGRLGGRLGQKRAALSRQRAAAAGDTPSGGDPEDEA